MTKSRSRGTPAPHKVSRLLACSTFATVDGREMFRSRVRPPNFAAGLRIGELVATCDRVFEVLGLAKGQTIRVRAL